ncbi:MAG: ABC transporter permease, partial [Bacteroidota bacterium]
MIGYILRKTGYALAVLFGVVTTAFLINFVLPGDPARLMLGQRADEQSIMALRVQLGLDKPMYEQYTKYVTRLVQGDLGVSYSTNRGVLDTIIDKFPATALLAVTAMFFSTLIGIGLGIIAAIRSNTWIDASTMGFALLGISLPSFVFGLLLLLLFAEVWKIFPSSGY